MRISSNPRIAFHAPGSETTNARNLKRWAVVRLIFGFLQMFGVAFSLGQIVYSETSGWRTIRPIGLGSSLSEQRGVNYSYLRATMGSTRIARRAGM
jgi:hypothetical protein